MRVNNVLWPFHPYYLLSPLLLLLSPPPFFPTSLPPIFLLSARGPELISVACVLRVGVIYWTTGHFP